MKTCLYLPFLAFSPFFLNAQCDADFSASDVLVCGGELVSFSVDAPIAGAIYTWNFGFGGATAIGATSSVEFPSSLSMVSYVVSLNVNLGDTLNCADNQLITVEATPTVEVIGSGDRCLPSTSTATTYNTSFEVTPTTGTYDWNFGDGDMVPNSTEYMMDHTYSGFGSYLLQVSQTIGNCTDTYTQVIDFFQRPSADMNVPEEFIDICEGQEITISNNTTSSVAFFVIDWGNGDRDTFPTTATPPYRYFLDDDQACSILEGAGQEEFDIVLYAVAGGDDCNHSNSSPIFVTPLPRPSFDAEECICFEDMPVTFDNTSCAPFDHDFLWNFGDPASGSANTSTDRDGTHTYSSPGTYVVTLEATSQLFSCGSGIFRDTIEVVAPPDAGFSLDGPLTTCVPTTYRAGTDVTDDCTSFEWNIQAVAGGGMVMFLEDTDANSSNPVFRITSPGEYLVELTTTNSCGTDTQSETIVYTSEPTIILPQPPGSCGGGDFLFQPTIIDNGCVIEACSWTVTDSSGATIISDDPNCSELMLTLTEPGTYTISFTATNCCGPTTVELTLIISDPPVAGASGLMDDDCVPAIIRFDNTSTNAISYVWTVTGAGAHNFIEGTSETSENPVVELLNPGEYQFELTAMGCETVMWDTAIIIFADPVPTLEMIPDAPDCGSYSFTPQSSINDGGCTATCEWILSRISGEIIESFSGCTPPEINLNTSGEFVLTLTTINCCSSVTVADTFFVSEFPVADASYQIDSTFGCAPVIIEFNNTSSFNETNSWVITPNTGFVYIDGTSNTSENPVIQINEQGEYLIQLTIENACSTSLWDTTIVVYELPGSGIVAIDDACDELTFTPATTTFDDGGCPATCRWQLFRDDVLVESYSDCNPPEVIVDVAGNYRLDLEVTNCCGSVSYSEDFFIQASEIVNAGADTSLCIGQPCLPLPPGGTWTLPDGTAITEFCPTTVGVFDLTFIQTSGLCEGSDGLVITVHPLPDVSITDMPFIVNDTIRVCSYDPPFSLTATPPLGQWNSDSPALDASGTFTPAIAEVGGYTINYAYTDTLGCSNSDDVIVIVSGPQPLALTGATFCESPDDINLEEELGVNEEGGSGSWEGPGLVDPDSGTFNSIAAGAVGTDTLFAFVYTFTTEAGCVSSDTIDIQIVPPVLADIGPDTTICIAGETLQLESNLSGFWSSDDGNISPSGLVDLVNTGAGIFDFYFVAFPGESCETRDTITLEIIDMGAVEAGPNLYLCETVGVFTLTDFSLPPDADGQWTGIPFIDADNGVFTVQALMSGSYTLYYTASSSLIVGCAVTDSLLLTIDALPAPMFSIDGTPCIGESLTFINESTGADRYEWFVDGTPVGTSTNLPYVFLTAGDYEVLLLAFTSEPGSPNTIVCEEMISQIIHISEPPTFVGFTATPLEGCAELDVLLVNNSIGENLSFSWLLDGVEISTATDSLWITLPSGRTDTIYTIQLVVNNNCGGQNFSEDILVHPLPVAATGTITGTFCSGQEIPLTNNSYGNVDSYEWWLNDMLIGTDSIPPDVQWFTDSLEVLDICLIARNECGVDTSCIFPTIIPSDVNAFFFIDTTRVCVGDSVNLMNLSSEWADIFYDFGDGSGSTLPNPSHAYAEAGNYQVILQASGCGIDTMVRNITVYPLPEVSFSVEGLYCPNGMVHFINHSDTTEQYQWDFGDGNVSDVSSPVHRYDSAGTYTVCLTAVTEFACGSTVCQDVVIEAAPIAAIVAPDSVCVGELVSFAAANPMDLSNCEWRFSDGFFIDDCAFERSFPVGGNVTVQLYMENEFGCTDSLSRVINVRPTPLANFEYEILDPCAPGAQVRFVSTSLDATGLEWYIDGVPVSQDEVFEYTFAEAGDHIIRLLATNDGICEHEFIQNIFLEQTPILDFELTYPCETERTNLFVQVDVPATFSVLVFNDNYDQEGQRHFDLADDTYEVWVTADNGCEADTMLTLVAPPALEIELTPTDTSIVMGEVVPLRLMVNTANTQITWTPTEGLSDTSILEPLAMPFRDTRYLATATDERGCIAVDTSFITVKFALDSALYIPNIFTPDGNGRNEVFRVRSRYAAVEKVESFEVFDRYGALMFSALDYDPRLLPPEGEWDGTFRDEPVSSGNYVWRVKVHFVNGDTHEFHGEVKLVR